MNNYSSPSFKDKTGKGVKVAVLDSGVNIYHSHINKDLKGKAFRVNREQYIETSTNIRDFLGHGTAITAVVRYMAQDADIVIGKIFDEQLASYPSVLAEAIYWAIEENVQVINLSLAIQSNYEIIEKACQEAIKNNIAIVSAMDKQGGLLWPGNYDGVFNISAKDLDRHQWQYDEDGHYLACGVPRELPEDIQLYNIHGHSFAAAHFTSWIARFLEHNGGGGFEEVNGFIKNVLKEKV